MLCARGAETLAGREVRDHRRFSPPGEARYRVFAKREKGENSGGSAIHAPPRSGASARCASEVGAQEAYRSYGFRTRARKTCARDASQNLLCAEPPRLLCTPPPSCGEACVCRSPPPSPVTSVYLCGGRHGRVHGRSHVVYTSLGTTCSRDVTAVFTAARMLSIRPYL